MGEVYIIERGLHVSAFEHARILILNNFVLLAYINTIYNYCHTSVIKGSVGEVSIVGAWASYISAFKHARVIHLCALI